MQTPEDVVAECWNYIETVLVFSFFQKKLQDANIEHSIEKDVEIPSQTHKERPDIIIYKDGITDIIEHKASLPNYEELAIKEVKDSYEKYHKVLYNGCEYEPNVILLYPKKKQYMIDKIKKDIPKELQLCYFELGDRDIGFQKDTKVTHPDLGHILKYSSYPCMRHEFSKHKWIKAEPPIVYTAFEVDLILRTFLDVKTIMQEQFIANRADVITNMNSFYPPWINENLMQISGNRLNNALEFLEKIDMIQWEKSSGEITVYRGKGTRSGDYLKTIAKKWCKLQQKEEKQKSTTTKATIQKSLYE